MAYSYKCSISFGLVYIPVTLHASVKTQDVGFNMLDKKTMSRVKYKKTCEECDGREVKQEDIVKGYEYEDDKYVVFTEEDFEKIKTKKDKNITIQKDAKLNIGKFAIWRLKTHGQFGGTWLSDYVPNRLGGFLENEKETEEAKRAYEKVYLPEFADGIDRTGQESVCFAEFYENEWQDDEYRKYCQGKMNGELKQKEKPDCPLIGADGNIFNLVGIASRTLKRNGLGDDAKEMTSRVFSCGSYEEALGIIGEYVNITGVGEEENMDGGMTPEM